MRTTVETLRARTVTAIDEIDVLRETWDDLAVAAGRPLSAPAWQLAWWRAMAPAGADLRVIVVEDADRLVGIAAFAVVRWRSLAQYLPLGGPDMGVRNSPLAQPGHELPVARALATELARSSPPPAVLALDQIDVGSPWPMLLRRAWPGVVPPRLVRSRTASAPTLHLDATSYDAWLASKSANFRQRLRRDSRKLSERGAVTSLATTPAELERALDHFRRLHGDRWGDATALTADAGHRMMLEAGLELLPIGRFRVWTIAIGDAPVTVQVFVAAGGEVTYWNGGWDPEFSSLSPAMLGICAGIEDAFARGERRIDFGEGGHHYTTRLADHDEDIEWVRLYPRTRAYGATLLATAPERARSVARNTVERLPDAVGDRLRGLRRRATPPHDAP